MILLWTSFQKLISNPMLTKSKLAMLTLDLGQDLLLLREGKNPQQWPPSYLHSKKNVNHFLVSLANATQWNQNLLKVRHALIQNSWQLILGKVSKGFDLSLECWYNQNRCKQRMQASQKSSFNNFLSHNLKESKEKFLSFNKKRSGRMFFFLSLLVK